MSLLGRASRRYLAGHPWQIGLAVAGVALGVAVVVSVDLANASSERAFELAAETVAGRATDQVVGGPSGLPDELVARLVVELGVGPVAPVVEGWVTVAGDGGIAGSAPRVLRVLGVDPLSEAPFRPWLAGLAAAPAERGGAIDLGAFLTLPGAAVLTAETAGQLAVGPGDELTVIAAGRERTLVIAGLLDPGDELSRQALADLAVVDLATAQELLARVGRLSRIDLILPDDAPGRAAAGRIEAALSPGLRLAPAAGRSRVRREMTRAFRLNLTALSSLALVCGLFLIYNAMTFTVVERRGLLGLLRTLGATRGRIFRLVLGEAAVIGAVGTALGLGLGTVLARGMLRLVTRTVNDLYFVTSVRELSVDPRVLAAAALLGVGATVAAAAVPAWEATRVSPRAAMTRSRLESGLRRALPRVTAAAAALLALGAGLLAWPTRGLAPAFAGLLATIVGAALLAPAFTLVLTRLLARPLHAVFGLHGRLAARGVAASLSRTSVAIAALAVAVSVTIGVGVMIASFRGTVVSWLGGAITADVYVSPAGGGGAFDDTGIDPSLAPRLAAIDAVARVRTIRRTELPRAGGEPDRVIVVDTDRDGFRGFEILAGDARGAWRAFSEGAVLVSESYAFRREIAPGDRLELTTDRGPRAFPVAAVYASYASDRGLVLVARSTWRRYWDDERLSGVSIELVPGVEAAAAIPRLRAAAGPDTALVFQSSRELLAGALTVFDRTFVVTGVLRMLAGAVAFLGVLSALLALALERAKELAVLRAHGVTRPQVWRLVISQTGLMGVAAGLLSLPVGLALAAIMIRVVNRRSFGWTLPLTIEPGVLVEALALSIGAALLAGLYPAWRMARMPPAEGLREE